MKIKYKITAEIEIDIQNIFKENIKGYVEDNSISDEAYTIQSIYGVIRDGCTEQIKDKCEWMFKDCYNEVKHHKEIDILIGNEILKNLNINKI